MVHSVCFQVFDVDKDGVLNEVELVQALGHLCVIREENLPVTDESLNLDTHASSLAQKVLQQYSKTKVCIYIYVCLYICVYICMYLCVYIYVSVCLYLCTVSVCLWVISWEYWIYCPP